MKTEKIAEAPNYQINAKGEVTNIGKGTPVFASKGKVGLYVGKERKFFSIEELVTKYFPETKSEEKVVEKEVVTVEKNEPVAKEKKEKEGKVEKEGKESGAKKIREAYDKDRINFDAKKFSEESGISMARITGCLKKYEKQLNNA